jgi:hypothetical protein
MQSAAGRLPRPTIQYSKISVKISIYVIGHDAYLDDVLLCDLHPKRDLTFQPSMIPLVKKIEA